MLGYMNSGTFKIFPIISCRRPQDPIVTTTHQLSARTLAVDAGPRAMGHR